VVIEESAKGGKFKLTADDPEFRKIMRDGIEREAARLSGKTRNRFQDLVFTRQFTTFDRQNPHASQSPFHGFFTLFWLAMALLLVKIAAQNWKDQGSIFGKAEILHLMVDRDLFVLLATDAVICLSTASGFLFQKAIANGYLTWDGSGWIIQSIWEMLFTGSVIWFSFYREWPWTHTVFIVLHVFVLLMKQHSYTFSNGYCKLRHILHLSRLLTIFAVSRVYRRRKLLQEKLKQLENIEAHAAPAILDMPSATGSNALNEPTDLHHRRHKSGPKYSTDFSSEGSEISSMAQAIENGSPLDADQIQLFTRVLKTEITVLTEELRGKSTTASKAYPHNLTLTNFLDWTCLPTLVYELEYPRQATINWWYVAEKLAATLGVIWVMIIISQAYIYPVVISTMQQKEAGMTLEARWKQFPWVVSDMLFPLLLEQLLAWYVIWECVLNVLAELTRFADRSFYGDWWNSVSWDQYARDWNRPVHFFLLRHVYHSSISAFRLSKMSATFVTFLLSAVVHELLMFCLFKKVRGYLFAMQLAQIPLAAASRTRLFKGRDMLGNVVFWFGLFIGPSLITGLYLVV
jgi:sterol O-acyltransferase